jgi:hypothetical protein
MVSHVHSMLTKTILVRKGTTRKYKTIFLIYNSKLFILILASDTKKNLQFFGKFEDKRELITAIRYQLNVY